MTDDEEKTMQQLGITWEARPIFHFQGHRYERLADAVAYARKQAARDQTLPVDAPT